MKILAIETSCDETAVCVVRASGSFGRDFRFDVLGNALYSQAAVHAPYGGVFPNLAKREHARNLVPLMREALRQADMLTEPDLPETDALEEIKNILAREPELFESIAAFVVEHGKAPIDAIAVTAGPGLEPALWVGINFAKALSRLWNVPIVAVNHMEGHILLSLLTHSNIPTNIGMFDARAKFPMIALLISGGHTELVLSECFRSYRLIGETRDDAAGEAFDKVARLLDLPYPGGPEISRLAAQARAENLPAVLEFTRPMLRDESYDFSFSGLKTAVRKLVEQHAPLSDDFKKQIAREFEQTVSDVLVGKTLRAADEFNAQTIVVGGGVSANAHIRAELSRALEARGSPAKLLIPPPELATDNAIMIALAGYFSAQNGAFIDHAALKAYGGLKLEKTA